jgi:Type ISP C-terminal specificity domain
MMQSLLEASANVKVRECFRRPKQTDVPTFKRVEYDLARTASPKASMRSHRKAGDASSKRFPSPLEHFHQIRPLASIQYPVAGSNLIEVIRYTKPTQENEKGRVWINQTQYFEGVSPILWNYSLSGRQICQTWLQDRQGSVLCYQSIQHYQQMLTILKDVVELMAGIDAVFQERQLRSKLSVVGFH